MTGPAPARNVPPRLFSVLSALAVGVVVYFAVKILLVSPGNVLALVCLVLMGLAIGNTVRRSGVTGFASVASLVAAVLAALLAFVLGRAG
ncbi:hypothetical protein [Deinococcus altitudinis]|uniref:hypothetical protein n=1 Tax=Deinococcus altitudinis TaxID=468914 RepID=UPI00389153AA